MSLRIELKSQLDYHILSVAEYDGNNSKEEKQCTQLGATQKS